MICEAGVNTFSDQNQGLCHSNNYLTQAAPHWVLKKSHCLHNQTKLSSNDSEGKGDSALHIDLEEHKYFLKNGRARKALSKVSGAWN